MHCYLAKRYGNLFRLMKIGERWPHGFHIHGSLWGGGACVFDVGEVVVDGRVLSSVGGFGNVVDGVSYRENHVMGLFRDRPKQSSVT